MRVISCMLLLAVLSTTLTGCSLFKKNTNTSAPSGVGTPAPPKFPGANDPILNSNIGAPAPAFPPSPPGTPGPQGAAKGPTTILAGTVTDMYNRPVSNAYIRLVSTDGKEAGAPVDVPTDARGHFIIQGVKTGQLYKLIARTKLGDKMLAGESLRSAPDVRVVITIREDLVNSNTPPMPGGPAPQSEPGQGLSNNADGASKGLNVGKGVEANLPATMTVPANPPAAGNPAFVPSIAEAPKEPLPRLQIPSKPAIAPLPNDPPRFAACWFARCLSRYYGKPRCAASWRTA